MNDFNQLTALHLDILKEAGNIGAGHSATALSALLNKRIEMKIPDVSLLSFNELTERLGGPEMAVAGLYLRIEGDLPGSMYFILSIEQAERFIRNLTKDPWFNIENIEQEEIGTSALKELGNIVTGSYLTALSDFTGLSLYPSVPGLSIDMFAAVITHGLIELSHVSDYAIVIDTAIQESGDESTEVIQGHFFLMPDPDSFDKLFKSIGV
ncbi:CheY-P-specific phosphatase CheC [Bacillus sp. HMSC76G11]|uniref:CheY-P-specific phosphatase CheC n=1 Tax=Metabacillus idriensis TaxID=324768 RepID=A0A6I2MB84_9BACI|nr:chemotaxis protein CheC [Metabacillus idriensis]MRX53691.1 CheY-P-specific phosphatase CheC [Metabacillus idriensis]OHR64884.1 CheY-P-specific phosphatase CheC [Bacillus sp. HMSC76G11]